MMLLCYILDLLPYQYDYTVVLIVEKIVGDSFWWFRCDFLTVFLFSLLG